MVLDSDLGDNAAIRLCEELSARDGAPRGSSCSAAPRKPSALSRPSGQAQQPGCAKTSLSSICLRVIRGVARGETWLPPAELGQVLRLAFREKENQRDGDRCSPTLTPREREVLALLAEGAGRREVAQRMYLSANTVRTHVQNLLAKLGVHSTLEAVALIRPHLDRASPGDRPVS